MMQNINFKVENNQEPMRFDDNTRSTIDQDRMCVHFKPF